MADLEDFFAKRDKKKKKAGKFEADNVAKILEKKRVDLTKSSYQPVPSESSEPISEYKAQEDDDEWREAVEAKPDYTGLKIQELVLDEDDEEEKDLTVEDENQREGPWRIYSQHDTIETSTTEIPQVIVPETKSIEVAVKIHVDGEEPEDVESEETAIEQTPDEQNIKKKYVPPGLRKALETQGPVSAGPAKTAPAVSSEPKPLNTGPAAAYIPVHKRIGANPIPSGQRPKKSVVPNINDKDFFPSLGEATAGKS